MDHRWGAGNKAVSFRAVKRGFRWVRRRASRASRSLDSVRALFSHESVIRPPARHCLLCVLVFRSRAGTLRSLCCRRCARCRNDKVKVCSLDLLLNICPVGSSLFCLALAVPQAGSLIFPGNLRH